MTQEGIPFLALTGFVTIALGLLVIIWGYQAGRKRDFKNHRRLMITSVIVLASFLVQYLFRVLALHQETPFTGPTTVRNYIYLPILIVHITFAVITIGIIIRHLTKSLGNEQRTNEDAIYFPKEYRQPHRRLGKIALFFWFFSYLGGIIIFLLLYVFYNSNTKLIF